MPPVLPAPSPAKHSSPRFAFIDRLRGLAVLVMIETHTYNALLNRPDRGSHFFAYVNFLNGLVAPSFLFCAGVAFAISVRRKRADYLSLKPSFWSYVRRLLFILMVAYSLHVPIFSLRQMLNVQDAQSWTSFFQVDILQVIAITLLGALALFVSIRNDRVFLATVSILTVIAIFLAPAVNQSHYPNLPMWFRAYFSHAYDSQFPMLPWSAFLMAGILAGWAFMEIDQAKKDKAIQIAIGTSLIVIVVSLVAEWLPFRIYSHGNFWIDSPQFFLVRLALIIIIGALLWRIEKTEIKARNDNSLLLLFGMESLLVYTVHLVIVYGHSLMYSYSHLFPQDLSYTQCFGLYVALVLAMYGLAYLWHNLKAKNLKMAKIVQYAVVAIVAGQFIISAG
ncbi:MAG TPA: heparan-alpha-glucosaminide N-acetyltransferase domain-containing protein [Bacteroidota bacterium]|nr:heparan-alpha-glucosaminide N-acetyltransferase domain-containing protein [Bacteroidota bacterium]